MDCYCAENDRECANCERCSRCHFERAARAILKTAKDGVVTIPIVKSGNKLNG